MLGGEPSWLEGFPPTGHKDQGVGGRTSKSRDTESLITLPAEALLSACMPPGTGSSLPKFRLSLSRA